MNPTGASPSPSDSPTDSHSHSHSDGHSHGRQHGHGYEHQDPADWIPGVELDAKVSMPPVMALLTAEIDLDPTRILDVGCGPGIGTVALAREFATAEVCGLDVGEAVLAAARERAESEDLASRVSFVRGDFDQDLGRLVDPVDLAFASMSLHHTEDPGQALARVCATLVPGGRVVLAEFGRPLTMFPDHHPVSTSGLWHRWQGAANAHRLDHLGQASVDVDWLGLLEAQGLDQVRSFEADIRSPAPLGELDRAWLAKGLRRGIEQFGDRLDAGDRATVQALLVEDDRDGVARSSEVFVDTSRMIYTGIRAVEP